MLPPSCSFIIIFFEKAGGLVGKRLILLLTAVIIIPLSLMGCMADLDENMTGSPLETSSDTASAAVVSHSLVLPYDNKDTLNPFTAKTLSNTALLPVLYDGLIRLTDKFEAEPVVAEKVTLNGTVCTVQIRGGIVFSDGSKITGNDIVYSYQKANASSRYQAQLQNVTSVKASGNTVTFQLKEADPLFVNLLDFPIVKNKTGDDALPIGSGRYTASVSGSSAKLLYNKRHFRGKTPKQTEIPLVSMPDHEAMLSSIKTGALSAVYSDLSKGELSSAGALSAPVNSSNLVYLGYNVSRPILSDPVVRRAIACAIDRGTVFYKGFAGRGSQASLPIHPLLGAKMEVPDEALLSYDLNRANELLDTAYKEKNAAGYRLRDGEVMALTILVNADNNSKKMAGTLLKDMLETAGFQVTVSALPFSEYEAAVKAGNYDLYVGEIKLLNNMNLDVLLNDGNFLAGNRSEKLLNAYRSYCSGGKYETFVQTFYEEMPFLPLLFRSGILIYNRNIQTQIVTSVSDVYYNLEEWQ